MDVFKYVKEHVDIVKTCEILGIKLNKQNKAICPFHKEKTPSFSVSPSKQLWKCFGCDDGGDVISLTSKLLNISPLDACKYLSSIHSLQLDFKSSMPKITTNKYKQRQEAIEKFKLWENKTFQLLCDYYHSLKGIKKYQEQDKIEYYIDIFIFGTMQDKLWFKKSYAKAVQEIGRELRKRNNERVQTV